MFQKIGKGYVKSISGFLASAFKKPEQKSADNIMHDMRLAELNDYFKDPVIATHALLILNETEKGIDSTQEIFNKYAAGANLDDDIQNRITSYLRARNFDVWSEDDYNRRSASIIELAAQIKSGQYIQADSAFRYIEAPGPFIIVAKERTNQHWVFSASTGKYTSSAYSSFDDARRSVEHQTDGQAPVGGAMPRKTHGPTDLSNSKRAPVTAAKPEVVGDILAVHNGNETQYYRIVTNLGDGPPRLDPMGVRTAAAKYEVDERVLFLYNGKEYKGTIRRVIKINGILDHYVVRLSNGRYVNARPSAIFHKIETPVIEPEESVVKAALKPIQDDVEKMCAKIGVDFGKERYTLDQVFEGTKVEAEHTEGEYATVKNLNDAVKTALTHLEEDPQYYAKLRKIEAQQQEGWLCDQCKTPFTTKPIECPLCGSGTFFESGTTGRIDTGWDGTGEIDEGITTAQAKKSFDWRFVNQLLHDSIDELEHASISDSPKKVEEFQEIYHFLRKHPETKIDENQELFSKFISLVSHCFDKVNALTNREAQQQNVMEQSKYFLKTSTDTIRQFELTWDSLDDQQKTKFMYRAYMLYFRMKELLDRMRQQFTAEDLDGQEDIPLVVQALVRRMAELRQMVEEHFPDPFRFHQDDNTDNAIINGPDLDDPMPDDFRPHLPQDERDFAWKHARLTNVGEKPLTNRIAQEIQDSDFPAPPAESEQPLTNREAPKEVEEPPLTNREPEEPEQESGRRSEVIDAVGQMKEQIKNLAKSLFKIDLDDSGANEVTKKILETAGSEIASVTVDSAAAMFNPDLAHSSGPKRGPDGKFH